MNAVLTKRLKFSGEMFEKTFDDVYFEYLPFIKKKARVAYGRFKDYIDLDYDDVLSEHIFGFYKAFTHYDENVAGPFLTYATLAMYRQFLRTIRKTRIRCGSIEELTDWHDLPAITKLEEELYYKELLNEVMSYMDNNLTVRQRSVILEFAKWGTYEGVMETLNLNNNEVRGGIYWGRKKIKDAFSDIEL